jgi:hypothetical protein
LLTEVIKAGWAAELTEAKVDLVTHLLSEGGRNLDADEKFRDAAKLQIALEVLERYSNPTTEKFKTEILV